MTGRNLFFLAVLLSVMTGCTHVERVKAIEGDASIPYDSLGTLEVKMSVPVLTSEQFYWTPVELLTLGFAHSPSQADSYKRLLQNELVKKARSNYDADAVIHVEYWPDLSSKKFPSGEMLARGQMIRYKRFPKSNADESSTAEPEDASAAPPPPA